MTVVVSQGVAGSGAVAVYPAGGERLTLDPLAESTTNRPLELSGTDASHGIYLIDHDYPAPDRDSNFASSVDSEGERLVHHHYKNRQITAKLRVSEPGHAASTNLVSNPSFETDTNGWSVAFGASLTQRSHVELFEGESVAAVSCPSPFAGASSSQVTVAPSLPYTASMIVRAGSGSASYLVYVQEFDAAGASIGFTLAPVVASPDVWQQVTVSRQFGSAGVKAAIGIFNSGGSAGEVLIDRCQLEQSPAYTAYFDGDTPGCSWNGTPHASTSNRPAPGGARFMAIIKALQQKVTEYVRNGTGTLRRQVASGNRVTFDLCDATIQTTADRKFFTGRIAEVTLTLGAAPFGRGQEITLASASTASSPVLSFLASGVPGDVPALGRLTVTEPQGVARSWLAWGQESKAGPGSAAVAGSANALHLPTNGLTKLGSSTTWSIGSGYANRAAIGVAAKLTPAWAAHFSTTLPGGQDLQHVGEYRVLAALYLTTSNTGSASVRLDWGVEDFRSFISNPEVAIDPAWAGSWRLIDLGTVSIEAATKGSHRWQGRFVAKSTVAGDQLGVEYLALVPASDGFGEASAVRNYGVPATVLGRDEFDQSAGNLTGKTMASGGVWASGGASSTDFTVDATYHYAKRSASDNLLRFALAPPTLVLGNVAVQMDFAFTAARSGYVRSGLLARYVDANNWLGAWVIRDDFFYTGAPFRFEVSANVGGVLTSLYVGSVPAIYTKTMRLVATTDGQWNVWLDGSPIAHGSHGSLVSGGVLASGRVGMLDLGNTGPYYGGPPGDRAYDNFVVFDPITDAVLFAGRSAEFRDDAAIRADSTGTYWAQTASYVGDRFYLPPAGREGSFTRLALIASRGLLSTEADPFIDGLGAQVSYTPRFLILPED